MTGWIVLGIAVVLALWILALYNGLVRRRILVAESWAQIDVELRRRYDLVPNLVETVKGYAAHELTVFDAVTRARAAAQGLSSGSPGQREAVESTLSTSLVRLTAVAEAYPDLLASNNFLQLQHQLTETEDRIAAARRLYNGNVRSLNTALQTIPTNAIGSAFGMRQAEFFDAGHSIRSAARVVL